MIGEYSYSVKITDYDAKSFAIFVVKECSVEKAIARGITEFKNLFVGSYSNMNIEVEVLKSAKGNVNIVHTTVFK